MATIAISLGVGLVTSFASSLFTPVQEGPRLDDLKFPKSEWGQQIPRFYGRMRLGGNIIWATDIFEAKKITKKGGRGGGGKSGGGFGKATNYTYTINLAAMFASGQAVRFAKVWVNGELKYDVSPSSSDGTVTQSLKWASEYAEFFLGGPSQLPAFEIEARMGSQYTPAYRDRIYLTLADYPAEGNISLEAELYQAATQTGSRWFPQGVRLSDIILDFCRLSGLQASDVNVTDLTSTFIPGFFIQSPSPIRNALQQLMSVYFFDVIETGTVIRFQMRKRPVNQGSESIAVGELGVKIQGSSANRFEDRMIDSGQLPREVSLSYIDVDNNYERNVVKAFRQNSPSSDVRSIDLPLVLTKTAAQRVVDRYLTEFWVARREIKFTLLPKYLALEPGDLITTDLYGLNPETFQIRQTSLAPTLITEVTCVPYAGDFTERNFTPDPYVLPVRAASPVRLRVLDIPYVLDTDRNFSCKVACSSARFQGCELYLSRDNGATYSLIRRILNDTPMGVCRTILPNYTGSATAQDLTSTVDVQIYNGLELESISAERFLDGENLALIGNELVWFRYADLQSTAIYRLSFLRRGRRGTMINALNHVANEPFTLLSEFLTEIQLRRSDLKRNLLFKALAPGQALDEVNPLTLTYRGISELPYQPARINAHRNGVSGGDIHFDVWRVDKRAGEPEDFLFDVRQTLSEPEVVFKLELRNTTNPNTLIRTLIVNGTRSGPVYTAAQLVADYGSATANITVWAYQKSFNLTPVSGATGNDGWGPPFKRQAFAVQTNAPTTRAPD